MANKDLILWQANVQEILPAKISNPADIALFAKQLSSKDIKQISQGFEAGSYEMTVNFVWTKAMAALKRELGSLGMKFIGELVNKPDLGEDDDVFDSITEKEAVRLAEELGVISSTEGMRLRHVQEMITHFNKLDSSEIEMEDIEMEEFEAINALKVCVKNILGKPKIEVATNFVEFREALESESLSSDNPKVQMLVSSPYFFHKLTISILMAIIKKSSGAKLEIALANINTMIPLLWAKLRDTEKWQIGHTYRDVYSDGQSTAVSGLQKALLKVKGFDFVPENLRSDSFVRAAEAVINAHEGMNNFYNEESPMRTLLKLGSVIPAPAFSICVTAILSVKLGNCYGYSFAASAVSDQMIVMITPDRWQYYLNECLPGDVRILQKMLDSKPRRNWYSIVEKYGLNDLDLKNKNIKKLIIASFNENDSGVIKAQGLLMQEYYGKKK